MWTEHQIFFKWADTNSALFWMVRFISLPLPIKLRRIRTMNEFILNHGGTFLSLLSLFPDCIVTVGAVGRLNSCSARRCLVYKCPQRWFLNSVKWATINMDTSIFSSYFLLRYRFFRKLLSKNDQLKLLMQSVKNKITINSTFYRL